MEIKYHATGAGRKALADAIGDIIGKEKRYTGTPQFAYEVGCYTVNKAGNVEVDGVENTQEISWLLDELRLRGFVTEESAALGLIPIVERKSDTGETEPPQADDLRLAISLPMDGFDEPALEKLDNLLKAKGQLIKKALGAESLTVKIVDERLTFPWFDFLLDSETVAAYTAFIAALGTMAKTPKHISAKEKEITNEKYTFRCFLMRLGFIGTEHKAQRKILLSKLSGSSAFKNGGKKNEISE